jgi:hypothetical protein
VLFLRQNRKEMRKWSRRFAVFFTRSCMTSRDNAMGFPFGRPSPRMDVKEGRYIE